MAKARIIKNVIREYCPECPLIEIGRDEYVNKESKLRLRFSPAGNQFNFKGGKKADFIVTGFCTSENAANNFKKYLSESDCELEKACKKSTFSGGQLRINLLRIFNGLGLLKEGDNAFNITIREFENTLKEYRTGSLNEEEYFKDHNNIFEENDRVFYTQVLKCCVSISKSSNQNMIIKTLEKDNFELVEKCTERFLHEVQERASSDKSTFIIILGSVLEEFLKNKKIDLLERLKLLGNVITVPHPSGNNTDRITIFTQDHNIGRETYFSMRNKALESLGE